MVIHNSRSRSRSRSSSSRNHVEVDTLKPILNGPPPNVSGPTLPRTMLFRGCPSKKLDFSKENHWFIKELAFEGVQKQCFLNRSPLKNQIYSKRINKMKKPKNIKLKFTNKVNKLACENLSINQSHFVIISQLFQKIKMTQSCAIFPRRKT